MAIPLAGLEQQHAIATILGETRGDGAPSRARPRHDEIEGFLVHSPFSSLGHGWQPERPLWSVVSPKSIALQFVKHLADAVAMVIISSIEWEVVLATTHCLAEAHFETLVDSGGEQQWLSTK